MNARFPKNKATALLLAALLTTSFQPAWAASADQAAASSQQAPIRQAQTAKQLQEIRIQINGKSVSSTDAKPFIDSAHSRTMVPLRLISEELGAKVDWNGASQVVTISQANTVIRLSLHEKMADVGGKKVELDALPVLKNGRTFVPLRFIGETLGADVSWDQEHKTVSIVTTIPSVVLTIDQAIQLALKNNTDLQTLRIDADSADLNARLVNAKVKDIPSDFIESLDLAQQKYVNQAKAEMAKKVNQLYVKATESNIRLGAQKAYYDLLNARAELQSKEQAMLRAETQRKVAEASFKAGVRAKVDVLQAQAAEAGAKAQLAVAQNNEKIAQMKLNAFIGTNLDKQWKLSDDTLHSDGLSVSLDEATKLALAQRAEVLQKQEEIKVAELNHDLIAKYSSLSTYQGELSDNEVEKAKIALEEQKKEITVEVAQAYLNLHSGQEALEANEKAMEAAKENYRLTNLRFENGMSTTMEVIQAQEELTNRENQYQAAVYNYNLAVISFENVMGK